MNWPQDEILILASASPRRAELLKVAGIPFEIIPAGDAEAELQGKASTMQPADYAKMQALAKAKQVAREHNGRIILGADTIVIIDNEILEKPADEAEACDMLQRLAGRRHTVISAIAIIRDGRQWSGYDSTSVEFLSLEEDIIKNYVNTGEPMDKAGAYGIQGFGAMMVSRIEGCYFNVMGLPLSLLGKALNSQFLDK
ncbi:MAG: septum formation protein Maf [bacterium]|nr:septum formation protein Maf [bacterium]MCP4799009.1 septum formation protein Maf [bacterium]